METIISIPIRDFKDNIGKKTAVRGWVMNSRSSGKVTFLTVRGGAGIVQCVLDGEKIADETYERGRHLSQESAVVLTGVISEEPRAPGGVEFIVEEVSVIGDSMGFPITPKSHGIDFLLTNRHLWLRSRLQLSIMRIRNEVVNAIRDFFRQNDFILIDTPILTGAIGESAGNLFSTEYFDLGNAYLAQTGQLYLEAAIFAFEKVYCCGPTFRAEKSKTRRHLTEFWMVEGEMAFYDSEQNMAFQEELVSYIVKRVLENCENDLKTLKRDTAPIEKVTPPFERISYDEAVEILKKKGSDIEWGRDLGGDDETIITKLFEKPVFVYNYPKVAKAFYMKAHPTRDDVFLCDDLLAPEGYGEIIGGSQREDDYDLLIAQIRAKGLPVEAYEWYLDLRRYGSVPHSGFGMGIERAVAWICGLDHLREAIPFPRMMGRIYP